MTSDGREVLINSLIVAGGLAVVLWFAIFLAANINAQTKCLRAGWASHDVTVLMEAYCIREENEYEITRPLSEVLNDR